MAEVGDVVVIKVVAKEDAMIVEVVTVAEMIAEVEADLKNVADLLEEMMGNLREKAEDVATSLREAVLVGEDGKDKFSYIYKIVASV